MPRGKVASAISQSLVGVEMILQQRSTTKAYTDAIDNQLRKLQDFVKKLKGPKRVIDGARIVMKAWELAKHDGLMYSNDSMNTRDALPYNVEGALERMCVQLRIIFKSLFIR